MLYATIRSTEQSRGLCHSFDISSYHVARKRARMLNILFSNLDPDTITNSFIAVILFFAVLGVCFRLVKKANWIDALPNIVVSLGILGTFVGICIGLYNFNVHDIDKSIPGLLSGLKTAFLTSIVGMVSSMLMRIIYESKSDFEERKIVSDDPTVILNDISTRIQNIESIASDAANSFLKCFKSDEEYSLVSQVKLIRQEMIDSRREIKQALGEFAEKLSEVSTKTIVEALKKVIDDFNVLLNELVSESFKELSNAMVNLNKWQDNYKEHVTKTENRINELSDNLESIYDKLSKLLSNFEATEKLLSKISVAIENISVDGNELAQSVEHLSSQNALLKESITQIKQIGEDAKSVIPDLAQSVIAMTTTLSETVDKCALNLEQASSKFIEENSGAIARFRENLLQSQTDLKDTITSVTNAIAETAIKFQENLSTSQNSLKETVEQLENHLEQQLTKSLDSLAGSLASLSEKFVSDYGPLTDRLRELVRVAETVDAKQ